MLIGDYIKHLWIKHIFRIGMICILSIGIIFFIKDAFSKEEFYIITDGPFSDALGWQNRLLK